MIQKLNLANLPTKIVKAGRLSKEWGVNLYIKRDDQTGSEISGNKIRKLEYLLKEAVENNYDTVITTGGIQSNHCRATAAAATMLGMKSELLLRISEPPKTEGNFFLDKLFGSNIHYCTPEEYRNSRDEIMKSMAEKMNARGRKCYIIPEGASNALGSLGYYAAMEEISAQEKEMGVHFDTIVVAVGSGGTYSGLCTANKELALGKRIIGFAVCDDSEYFTARIDKINREAAEITGLKSEMSPSDIEINDKYVGIGYALSRPEELEFIAEVASKEALVLDPVYTGKAMYGLYNEIKEGNVPQGASVLFIHTGGLFGLFPKQEQFVF
ncbi:MAG: D-cysteine desulfhydrase family protein [Bacteroidetes bacterium HGW-Bacteroidetes-10]|nr:MAG: D-cysteine desulfhydrase family protein [Bacteroidetes bacterium HGW-Bacteroidetes-10]